MDGLIDTVSHILNLENLAQTLDIAIKLLLPIE